MMGEDAVTYAKRISAALNDVLRHYQAIAKVGMRRQDSLLYIALEAIVSISTEEGANHRGIARDNQAAEVKLSPSTLLPVVQRMLTQLKDELKLGWVKLVKVSGRLPGKQFPLWQEDLLLARATPADGVSVKVGGNFSGQMIIGDNNQAYSYTYNVAKGGILNVAAPPSVRPRPTPIALKPKPIARFLDRQTVLPAVKSALEQSLPVEIFAEEGFGKTALLRYLSHDETFTARFADGVIYLPVHQQLAGDVLQSLYDVFYDAQLPFKPSYGYVQQALREKQVLVMLNGLTLKIKEMEQLLAVLPQSAFVMVSEERIYWQEGAAIALEGLPLPESVSLMQMELGRALSSEEQQVAQLIWRACLGNPLKLRRVAAQAKVMALVDTPEAESQTQFVGRQQALFSLAHSAQEEAGEPLSEQVLFQSVLRKLTAPQKAALALMGAMAGAALSGSQAKAITQLPSAATALDELVNLHLVETTGQGYRLSADLIFLVTRLLDPQPWLVRAADYFTSHGAAYSLEPVSSSAQSESVDALLHLLSWTQHTEQWRLSLALVQQLDRPLSMGRHWDQWQQVLQQGLRAAEQSGNGTAEAWALHQLGTRSLALGQLNQADTWLTRSLWLREQLGDTSGAAATRHNLGLIMPSLMVAEVNPMVPMEPSSTGLFERLMIQLGAGFSRFWRSPILLAGLLLGGVIGGVFWYRSVVSERPLLPVGLREQVEGAGANDLLEESTFSLSFIPTELAFGEVLLEERVQKSLQIKNESNQPLEIESFEIVDGQTEDFTLIEQTCTAAALPPGKRCQAGVLFEPTAAGDRTAKLKINASNSEGSLVFLSGVGISREASEPVSRVDVPPSVLQVNNDQVSVRSGGSVIVDVLANDVSSDGSALLVAEAGQPAAGETRLEGGRIVYAHGGGDGVRDRFTYTAQDASGQSASATVVITIENNDPSVAPEPIPAPTLVPPIEPDNLPDPQNEPDPTAQPAPAEETETELEPAPTVDPSINEQQPPSVSDYAFTIELGDSLTVNLLENARDPNPNDVLRVAEVANTPVGGDLIDNGDGTVTYLPWQGPEAEQFGTFTNSFQFVITDDNGGFAQGTLSIRVVVPALQVP
ncbi:MAG: choice-of-anchor D domain-containing protein [Cyanobacteria bacterium J06623_4]